MFERSNKYYAATFTLFLVLFSIPGINMLGKFIQSWGNEYFFECKLDRKYTKTAAKEILPPPPCCENRKINSPSAIRKKDNPAGTLASNTKVQKCTPSLFEKIKLTAEKKQTEIRKTFKILENTIIKEFPLRFEFSEYNMHLKRLLGMHAPMEMEPYVIAPNGKILQKLHFKTFQTRNLEHFYSLTQTWGGQFLTVIRSYPEIYYDPEIYSGYGIRVNKPLDKVRDRLVQKGIRVLDLRETFIRQDPTGKQLFFKTDHHWNILGGLTAARTIADYLNNHFGCEYDMKYLQPDVFEHETFHSCFIGSLGKKLTLAYMDREEDLLIYRPSWPTSFETERRINMKHNRSTVRRGDFSVFLEFDQIYGKISYLCNPYAVFCYGDVYLYRAINKNIAKGKKIVIIKDSYANIMVPYLALQTKEIIMLDERHTGNDIDKILLKEKPDIVIYMNSHFDSIIKD